VVGNKNFWESLKGWAVMVLMETWTEEKGWNKVKERLSRGHVKNVRGEKKEKRGKQ